MCYEMVVEGYDSGQRYFILERENFIYPDDLILWKIKLYTEKWDENGSLLLSACWEHVDIVLFIYLLWVFEYCIFFYIFFSSQREIFIYKNKQALKVQLLFMIRIY